MDFFLILLYNTLGVILPRNSVIAAGQIHYKLCAWVAGPAFLPPELPTLPTLMDQKHTVGHISIHTVVLATGVNESLQRTIKKTLLGKYTFFARVANSGTPGDILWNPRVQQNPG